MIPFCKFFPRKLLDFEPLALLSLICTLIPTKIREQASFTNTNTAGVLIDCDIPISIVNVNIYDTFALFEGFSHLLILLSAQKTNNAASLELTNWNIVSTEIWDQTSTQLGIRTWKLSVCRLHAWFLVATIHSMRGYLYKPIDIKCVAGL